MNGAEIRRRQYLGTLASGVTVGLAGCGGADESQNPSRNTAAQDQPNSESQTGRHWPFVHGDAGNANYVPQAKGPATGGNPDLSLEPFGDQIRSGGISANADPIIANDLLYVAPDNAIQAVDAAVGEIAHSADIGEPITGLGHHQETILAISEAGTVYGLSPDLSTVMWEQTVDTGQPFPPTARDGLAIIGGDDGLYGLSVASGAIQWETTLTPSGVNGNSHPIPLGEEYAFVYDGATIVAVDRETGDSQPLREQLNQSEYDLFEVTAPPVYRDGALFVTTRVDTPSDDDSDETGKLTKISTDSLEQEFHSRTAIPAVPFAVTDEHVLICADRSIRGDGDLYRYDVQGGRSQGSTYITYDAGFYRSKVMADQTGAYVVTHLIVGVADHTAETMGTMDQTTRLADGREPKTNNTSGALGFGAAIYRKQSESQSARLDIVD
jgi:outer membrane protein assembly factor BamB